MSQSAISVEWLKAAMDIDIINVEHPTPICAFRSQQAIEKTLKALIASKSIDISKIHSLNRLFEICKEHIKNSKPDTVNLLESLYVESGSAQPSLRQTSQPQTLKEFLPLTLNT